MRDTYVSYLNWLVDHSCFDFRDIKTPEPELLKENLSKIPFPTSSLRNPPQRLPRDHKVVRTVEALRAIYGTLAELDSPKQRLEKVNLWHKNRNHVQVGSSTLERALDKLGWTQRAQKQRHR